MPSSSYFENFKVISHLYLIFIAVAKPFTFGGTSFVMFKLADSYRRKLQVAMSNTPLRRRRSVVSSLPKTNSFSIEFRTRQADGLLFFAEDIGGNYTILHVGPFLTIIY